MTIPKILAAATIFSFGAIASSNAMQECKPGKADSRVRYCTYQSGQVYHLWTAPGSELVIEFSEQESVPEGNVAATDRSRLQAVPRGNFLYLKSTAKSGETPCMVPEPLLVTTKLPDGHLRPYTFQIETKPNDCSETPAGLVAQQKPTGMTLTSTGETRTSKPGNLKYVDDKGLDAGADVFYSAKFSYPEDDAATRRARWRAQHADDEKKDIASRLKQQMSWPYGDPFDGSWNYKYAAHGNLTPPGQLRDNGYQTVFWFAKLERVPALFSWMPGAQQCNRNHDDRLEATVIPSVHRSGANGDTIIAPGTAQGWCLRDGQTVLEIRNFGYSAIGDTPATGTVSPYVTRSPKTTKDEPEASQEPVPLAPPVRSRTEQQPRTQAQQPEPVTAKISTQEPEHGN
jgi:type IV secretory pathway VirB9-like protein